MFNGFNPGADPSRYAPPGNDATLPGGIDLPRERDTPRDAVRERHRMCPCAGRHLFDADFYTPASTNKDLSRRTQRVDGVDHPLREHFRREDEVYAHAQPQR